MNKQGKSFRLPEQQGSGRVTLSLVVPAYNEGAAVDRFLDRAVPALDLLHLTYEIVFVDDGSRDDTLERLVAHQRSNPAIRVVSLSRNFGKEAALTAGLDHAQGEAVVPIDCDLQDPPELIAELVARWREGYDVVVATRRSRRGETWLKRSSAKAFYRLFNLVAERPIPPDTGDFRLMDRRVVRVIRKMPERTRFMKGLFAWVGFRQTAVYYEREPRISGQSKWNYWGLWNFALEGIVSFSSFPLQVWAYLGLVSLLAAALGGGLSIAGLSPLGTVGSAVLVSALFLGGLQLVAVGVLGEYIARLLDEIKRRPLYLVSRRYGFVPRQRRRRTAPTRQRPVASEAFDPAEQDESMSQQPPAAA